MKRSVLSFIPPFFLMLAACGCVPISTPPTISPISPQPVPTAIPTDPSWEMYTNDSLGFSIEYPADWTVLENNKQSGFIGKQVFWWADRFDPMEQHGDGPSVDQVTETSLGGLPAKRLTGHYLGAIGDMGLQQYLRYVIKKGEVYYAFTLFSVNARGIPQDRMTEDLPLSNEDIALFEKMMQSLTFMK